MLKIMLVVIVAFIVIIVIYCLYKIWSILNNKLPMRKDGDMQEETKKSLWISIFLVVVNALGLAFLLNPQKFEEKKAQISEAIKKIFTPSK